jgi:hypothetical protein
MMNRGFCRDTESVYHALETGEVILGAAYNFPDPNDPDQAAEIGTSVKEPRQRVAKGQVAIHICCMLHSL